MKILFISLVLMMSTLCSSFGQTTKEPLNNVSEFYTALSRQFRYPKPSLDENRVAKAYVFFTVDDSGRIANVSVLNATNVDAPFTQEIKRVLTEIPAQTQANAGSYILPVEFQLEGDQKTIAAAEENAALINFLKEKKPLLSSIVIVGYTKS